MFVSPWAVEQPDYKPVEFTHEAVLGKTGRSRPEWADDPDVEGLKTQLNKRPTYEGPVTFDEKGRPLNPRGRTGMSGRGLLGRWGPNHAADLVLTREHPVTGKLQVVIVKRQNSRTAASRVTPPTETTSRVRRLSHLRSPCSSGAARTERLSKLVASAKEDLSGRNSGDGGDFEENRSSHAGSAAMERIRGGQDIWSSAPPRRRWDQLSAAAKKGLFSNPPSREPVLDEPSTALYAFPGKMLPKNMPFRVDRATPGPTTGSGEKSRSAMRNSGSGAGTRSITMVREALGLPCEP